MEVLKPLVTCPVCQQPIVFDYQWCPYCGTTRSAAVQSRLRPVELVDWETEQFIADRRVELERRRRAKRYEGDKGELVARLQRFLDGRLVRKHWSEATPSDITDFLITLDRGAITVVHAKECLHKSDVRSNERCECQKRAAASSVKTRLGQLQGWFNEQHKGGKWDQTTLSGNPCKSWEVSQHMKLIQEEQREADVIPVQAEPIFQHDSRRLLASVREEIVHYNKQGKQWRVIALHQDALMYTIALASGQRGGDVLKSMADSVILFPQHDGLIFNLTWGKTVRKASAHIFGVRQHADRLLDVVTWFNAYVGVMGQIGWDLLSPTVEGKQVAGYLFPYVNLKSGGVSNTPTPKTAMDTRLENNLRQAGLSTAYTFHSWRAGADIELALRGVGLAQTVSHIGWRDPQMATRYGALAKVLIASQACEALAQHPGDPETYVKGVNPDVYRSIDELRGHTLAVKQIGTQQTSSTRGKRQRRRKTGEQFGDGTH